MRITIKKKLVTGFGVLLLLFVVFGIVVLSDMADVQEQFSFVVEHDAPVIANANRLFKLVVDMETGQRGFCITHKEEFLEPYNIACGEFEKLLEIEKKLVSDNPSQEKALREIHDLLDQWHEKAAKPEIAMARIVAAAKNIDEHNKAQNELASLLETGTGKGLIDKIRAEFSVFIRVEEQLTKQRYANASQTTLDTRNMALLLVLFSVIFGSTIAVLSIRAIISPVSKLLKGTKIIGAGDLEHRIEINSKDEIGELIASFNQMVDKREQTEGHLQAANQQLQANEQQLKAINQQLRAHEQHLRAANQQLQSEITDRKQAEEQRKQSELKFRTLYESSGDAIMLVTADEGFFDCNDATVRLFGCKSKEEFCSKHPSDISPATQPCGRDSMTLANERMATAVKQGSNSFEWVHQKIDGSDFPADVLLNAMELDGKKVLQAVVRDVTERKQVEDRIKSVMAETERMNKLMMGREKRVIEMKKEVNALLAELGRQPQYKSVLKDETVVLSDKAE